MLLLFFMCYDKFVIYSKTGNCQIVIFELTLHTFKLFCYI